MILGIDPGKLGALVLLDKNGVHAKEKMPLIGSEIDIHALCTFFDEWKDKIAKVYIEDVHALFGASAKSTFEFGRGLGILEALIVSYSLPYQKVKPKTWQKKIFDGIPEMKKSNGKRDTKAMAYLAAKRLWPYIDLTATERSVKPHDGIVDALLIGHYGL